jgi:HSP20 family molecular chaperone IbpA
MKAQYFLWMLNHRKSFYVFAIHFIVTVEMPLYSGEADLSTKWRRSKKHLKWRALINAKNRSKIFRIETVRSARSMFPQYSRSSQNGEKRKWKAPNPLIDVIQDKNWITIVAEIAGFNKETLKINVKDQKVTLSAMAKDRRYYKSLNLPKIVIPNLMHTTYKNGVLEIKLKKAPKRRS